MKVLFCLPHLKLSGGVRVILTYANQLSSLGHEVVVAGVETSRKRRWLLNFFKVRPTWLTLDSKIKIIYLDFKQLDKVVKNLKPEVLVADSWPVAEAALTLNTNIPLIHTIQHDERLYHGNREVIHKVYMANLQKIAVATWLQEMLKQEFNQESDLLLNSFDRSLFRPVSEAKAGDGKVRVLVLDHPYKWKGTKEAVGLVKDLQLKYPELVLMGFGARADQASKEFDEFYFEPKQEHLAQIYSRADIYLCSSWDEGFGLPSLEAMACGAALVTYNNGGSRDFAIDGETALVAPYRDSEALKMKLESLIANPFLRTKLRSGGLKLTENWPTWQEQAQKLEKILKSVITQ